MDKETLKLRLDQLKKDLKLKQKKLQKADRIEKAKLHVQQKIKEQAELLKTESIAAGPKLKRSSSSEDFKNNINIKSEKATLSGKKVSVSFQLACHKDVQTNSPKTSEITTNSEAPNSPEVPDIFSLDKGKVVGEEGTASEKAHLPYSNFSHQNTKEISPILKAVCKGILQSNDTIEDSQMQFQELSNNSSRVLMKKKSKNSMNKNTTTNRRRSVKISPIPKILPLAQEENNTVRIFEEGNIAFIGSQKTVTDLKDESGDASEVESRSLNPESCDISTKGKAANQTEEITKPSLGIMPDISTAWALSNAEIPDSESESGSVSIISNNKQCSMKGKNENSTITQDSGDAIASDQNKASSKVSRRRRSEVEPGGVPLDFSFLEEESGDMYSQIKSRRTKRTRKCASMFSSSDTQSTCEVSSNSDRSILDCAIKPSSDSIESPAIVSARVKKKTSTVPPDVKTNSSRVAYRSFSSPKPNASQFSIGFVFPKFPLNAITSEHEKGLVEFSLPDEDYDLYKMAKEFQKSVEQEMESSRSTTNTEDSVQHSVGSLTTLVYEEETNKDKKQNRGELDRMSEKSSHLTNIHKEKDKEISEKSNFPSNTFMQTDDEFPVAEKLSFTSDSHRQPGDEFGLYEKSSHSATTISQSQPIFPDSISTFDSMFDSCSNSVSTQSPAFTSETSQPTRKTRGRWGEKGRPRKKENKKRETTLRNTILEGEVLSKPDSEEASSVSVELIRLQTKQDNSYMHTELKKDYEIVSVGALNKEELPGKNDQKVSTEKILSVDTDCDVDLLQSQGEDLFSQPPSPDTSDPSSAIHWKLLHSHQLEVHDRVIHLDYQPWHHSDTTEDVILSCTINTITLLKSGDSGITTLASWTSQHLKICQAVLYVEGSSIYILTSMEDTAGRTTSNKMDRSSVICCFHWTEQEQKSSEIDRFSIQEHEQPLICIGNGDLFVGCNSQSWKTKVSKYPIGNHAVQLSKKSEFEAIEDKLVYLLSVRNMDSALVGQSESTLYIWNCKLSVLVLTISLSLPLTTVQLVSAEAGILFLCCVKKDKPVGYLMAVNPNTSKSAIINHFESPTVEQSQMVTSTLSRDGHVSVLYSDGTVNLWSLFTGKLLGHKTKTGLDQLALHPTTTSLVCKLGTTLYTFRYHLTL